MNTIAQSRWNDHKGTDVAAVIDRAAEEMPDLIDGLMADNWDGFDPWGSTIEAAFALEYACQYLGLPTSDDFRSPYTTGDPDDGLLYVELRDAIFEGRISPADVVVARDVLSRMLHAFELAGLDY